MISLRSLVLALVLAQVAAQNTTNDVDDHAGHDHDDHDSHTEESKPWVEVLVASLIVNLVSLTGLIFVVLTASSKKLGYAQRTKGWKVSNNIIPSFACGALLATTVFLIVPEAIAMILGHLEKEFEASEEDPHAGHNHRFLEEDEHEEHGDFESDVAWRFGACFLGGFLIPTLTAIAFPHYHEPSSSDAQASPEINAETAKLDQTESEMANTDIGCETGCCDPNEEEEKEAEAEEGQEQVAASKPINWPLAMGILIGDFFHNFSDGIFIGIAFTLCSYDLAIAICLATVYHEIVQEISDFYMLTEHCNMKIWVALVLNFIGGLSVMLGALLILAVEINGMVSGCLLAIGGGVYVNIAATECLPRAYASHESVKDKLISALAFVIGVVPIGLVLLNHFHCGHDH